MAKIISPFEVADCNKAFMAAGFTGRIRLHDACGGQTLSYEGDDGLTCSPIPAEIRTWLERELSARGYEPVFNGDSGYFGLK